MNTIKQSNAGFTLIELMIVVIIVAVLAAVGIPLLQGNVERAKLTEAVAGLGTIRTAVRAKIAEAGTIPGTDYTRSAADTIAMRNAFGLKLGDLTGRFFEDNDYAYDFTAGTAAIGNPGDPGYVPAVPAKYCMSVQGDTAAGETNADAKKGSDVDGLQRSMDQDGTLYSGLTCATGNELN